MPLLALPKRAVTNLELISMELLRQLFLVAIVHLSLPEFFYAALTHSCAIDAYSGDIHIRHETSSKSIQKK